MRMVKIPKGTRKGMMGSDDDILARQAVFKKRIGRDIEQTGAVSKMITRSKTVPRMHAKKHR